MSKYKSLQIGIASPEEIISWANPILRGKQFTYNPLKKDKVTYVDPETGENVEYTLKGEVKKQETINYRSLKPEKDGLFCEVIFGPTKDYQCNCGKTRKSIGEHRVCDKCGVELTESKVRRERMGYIALGSPVVHTWYLRNTSSKIAILLDLKAKEVEDITYQSSYIVTEVSEGLDSEDIFPGRILSEQEHAANNRHYIGKYKAMSGAEAIKYLLKNVDLKTLVPALREEIKTATKQRKEKIIKRLDIAEAFLNSPNKPEWMVMDVIPVIPPDLRPMVQLDGGRFASTDLNDLYLRIIGRNIRYHNQYVVKAPELLLKNERRLIQEAVDGLIDNSKRKNKAILDRNRPLKSLSDILRGKQGRFRQNLLGKRVDYSGRSVIAIGPDLKMYQCGIPREMALILFKPFIIAELRKQEAINPALGSGELSEKEALNPQLAASNREKAGIKTAKELIDKKSPEAMAALEKIIVEHPVLLNRAPTLHRLSIQAYEPVLVEGKAIRLYPLATTPFNADFDGDQMPVHVPLSKEAQTEARMLMLASKNIIAPKDGKPIVTPTQDMILGNYYLTIERSQHERVYSSIQDVWNAVLNCEVEFNEPIHVYQGEEEQIYRDIRFLKDEVEQGRAPSVARFVVEDREGHAFSTISEVEHAYEFGMIDFHTRFVIPARELGRNFVQLHLNDKEYLKEQADTIEYREKLDLNEELKKKYIITTYGKIIFNQIFPDGFAYVNEPTMDNLANGTPAHYFVDAGENYVDIIKNAKLVAPFKKKMLSMIITEVFRQSKLAETSKTLDKMKDLGFHYSTIAGVTISVFDVLELKSKNKIIQEADEKVKKYNELFHRGLMLSSERRRYAIDIWDKATDDIKNQISKVMAEKATVNDIFMMADSGARGSSSNFTQLSGMRGLMAKPNGEKMDIPVKACFREGMSMSEFFISTHGSRKGSTDTALKTAQSGYLTRRLVDVSQDVTITMDDCGTDRGIVVRTLYKRDPKDPSFNPKNKDDICVPLRDRIVGRFTSKPVIAKSKQQIIGAGEFITEEIADEIISAGVEEVEIRTLLTCDARVGVCVKCYGSDLSTTGIVEKGEVVGIVAAQSIGEPGTQLTMRTFHSGGVASAGDDITQGLPRVQELFEAREPKGEAIISEIKGVVEYVHQAKDNRVEIKVKSILNNSDNDKIYLTDSGKRACVEEGEKVEPGDLLSLGMIHPKKLLRVASCEKVAEYIIQEVQKVYRTTASVDISDKHIEIIVKQMLQKLVIIDEGGTNLLPGTFISKTDLYDAIKSCYDRGLRCPVAKPVLLGITAASLKSDSFLAAASFQETTRVLTEAAIRGKVDKLEGLKENIIIGGLIPAGTGLIPEDSIHLSMDENEPKYAIKK